MFRLPTMRVIRRCMPALKPVPRRQFHEHFQYTRAIVGSLNDNFARGALRFEEPVEPINPEKAKKHHENYVQQLRKLLPGKILQIAPDHRFPDQVFVEDPAVVYDGIAMLTQMKAKTRAGEKSIMKPALEELGLSIAEMKNPDAYLDGGDVLFTGREFLIGLSSRTNSAGIEEFAKVFSKWPVTGITVKSGAGVLHLKSMSSMCAVDTIAISDTETGRHAWKEISSKAKYKYKKLAFPDDNGANCLFINGVVLHPAEEDYPDSYRVWQTLDCKKIPLPNSEMSKADGSLTCGSILIC